MASSPPSDLNDFLGAKPVPRWRRWGKWVLVAVGVILLALLLKSCFAPAAQVQYATETAQPGSLTVSVSATGKLAPINQVDVGSELSGLVTRVVVDVNDRVTAGQPLALIDPSRFQDAVNQSRAALNANQAQVAQAQATLAQSNAQLARLQNVYRLSGGRVPSRTELDQGIADRDRAIATLRAAQANVVSAQAALSSNATQLTKTVIRSPVTGVVLARQIEPGATVAASFNTPTLFVIAQDLSTMKLQVAIDEADVGTVHEGQQATFTVDAFPGRTFPARITRVDVGSNLSAQSSTTTTTTTTAQVVSYAALLAVNNATGELRPGMTATADIVTAQRNNVLLVPTAALRFRPGQGGAGAGSGSSSGGGLAGALVPRRPGGRSGGGGGGGGGGAGTTASLAAGTRATVYIKDATGEPRAVRVTLGVSNGTQTEVTGGDLTPGAEVITGQLAGSSSGSGSRRSGSGGGGQRRSGAGGAGGGGGGQ